MNIAVLSYHSCPYSLLGGHRSGGMNAYLQDLSRAMAAVPGVSLDIFTRSRDASLTGVHPKSDGIRVIHLGAGPERPLDVDALYHYVDEFKQNVESFMSGRPEPYDLIYSHYWLSGLVADRLRRSIDLPFVHTYHTLAFLKEKALPGPRRDHPRRIDLEAYLSRAADAVISLSSEEKASLVREYGLPRRKVKVIYPGINPRMFFPQSSLEVRREIGREARESILLYVGRIEPIKGLMNVIRAFELLRRRQSLVYETLKLVVIGGGRLDREFETNDEIRRVMDAVGRADLSDRVVFLGSKRQEDLKKYYTEADALVVPSLYESFGLVVLESLACGTPVLVSQVGKMRTIVREGKNGCSFDPYQPASLADCLERFFSHKTPLWDGEKIQTEILKKFSWDKTAAVTLGYFQDLIEARGLGITTTFQPGGSPRPV